MNNINKRFLEELFQKKKVVCDSDIYLMLYDDIWPCEKYFKQFLASTDTSVKIESAKKIFYYFNMYNEILIPDFFVDELISIQQHDLKKSNGYIPQDHLIHSVNLYILGVYVFFNIEVFHRKLLDEYCEANYVNKIKLFLKEWRMFSFYHDIGYVLESNIDESGYAKKHSRIKKYIDMPQILLHKHIIHCVTKLIVNVYIINTSNKKFEIDESIIMGSEWSSGKKIVKDVDLIQRLKSFHNSIRLEGVRNKKDYNYVYWLLQGHDYLVIYKNKFGTPLLFKFVNKENEVELIINSSLSSNYENFIKSNIVYDYELNNEEIVCEYYANDLKENILKVTPTRYQNEIFEYFNCIPIDIKNRISFASNPNSIEYVYTLIYRWLNETINIYDGEMENSQIKIATQKAFKIVFEKTLNDSIEKVVSEDSSTDEKIECLIGLLQNVSTERINSEIRNQHNEYSGMAAPIVHYFEYLYQTTISNLMILNKCVSINNDKIDFYPFNHNRDNLIASGLYKGIQEYSEALNIDFNLLESYKTDYTMCDHGVVSATLIFYIVSFNEQILKMISKCPVLNLSYKEGNGIDILSTNDFIKSYSKIIFSILLHNIYTKDSAFYGVNYKQDINVNAFSYFCTLMDNLQKWGRPKQLDLSVLDLPKENFLENDFDIIISNYNIKIICSTAFAGNMRAKINSLEDYLPGASHIIKICEEEI